MPSLTTIKLARLGSFTVGGRRIEIADKPSEEVRLSRDLRYTRDPNGAYAIEQAYVQYFVPDGATSFPIVLVHGGGMTGACWETTPDGREGWLQQILRAGHPTYVIDNVERGRAGWCPFPEVWSEQAQMRSERDVWSFFRFGHPADYERRAPFAGAAFPVEFLAELTRQQVPRWTTTTDQSINAMTDLLHRVGPCAVVAHSQGGGIAATAAAMLPGLVHSMVLIEPSGLPDTPAPVPNQCRQLIVGGDYIERSPVWSNMEQRWIAYVDKLRTASISAEYLSLPAAGHRGNSHIPMSDRNSDVIAAAIEDWMTLTDGGIA